MTDAMDYLSDAMDEVEKLLSENKRLKKQLAVMSTTSDEIDRAETIVALRKDVALWKGRYEFALMVMKEEHKECLTQPN